MHTVGCPLGVSQNRLLRMQRCVILLFCLCLLPFWSFSQSTADDKQDDLLGKGHWSVGVSGGGGYGSGLGAVTNITPRIQYFLADGWALQAEARYSRTGPDFSYLGGGLSTRYYFLRRNRLALFGQLGASVGQHVYSKVEPTDPYRPLSALKGTTWQLTAGAGAQYRLGARWSIEASVERSQLKQTYLIPDHSGWQGNIGLSFKLR